jgi:Dihydropteroate synthase and related enzymes
MFALNCNGRLLVIDKPLVMGIINATPDSFYEGSRFSGTNKILAQGEKMIGKAQIFLISAGKVQGREVNKFQRRLNSAAFSKVLRRSIKNFRKLLFPSTLTIRR